MFLKTYRRLIIIAALMLLGLGGASATTVPWSRLPVQVAPNTWARGADTSRNPASIRGTSATQQAPETFLYAFKGIPDGNSPSGGLIEDERGSLCGTTVHGGAFFPSVGGGGAVFKLIRTDGGYKESLLYSFGASGANDGYYPAGGSRLSRDRTGTLYGTTVFGGAFCKGSVVSGCGTVYKLTMTKTGYAETILYNFKGTSDGLSPQSNPIFDRSGALYGTAGSTSGNGVVYKLTPTRSGYAYNLLHVFGTLPNDGIVPGGALALDMRTGDLYGTTFQGGAYTYGTVFKLRPSPSGYVYSIIHIFHGRDGVNPDSSLIMDGSGALYGTTTSGGISGKGTVFKLTPTRNGYVESVLYDFTGGLDGGGPQYDLVADRRGNLYSTTAFDGAYAAGTVFELVRSTNGYRELTLHAFNENTDGLFSSGVLLDGDYLLGETLGAVEGPYIFGPIFALKL